MESKENWCDSEIKVERPEERVLLRIRALGVTDAEVWRRAIEMVGRLADAIKDGKTIVAVSSDEQNSLVDLVPELTKAVDPGRTYKHLERKPSGLRQPHIKGRRMTVAQLTVQMRVNGWDAPTASYQFDIPLEMVLDAVRYAEENAALIEADEVDELSRRP